MSVTIIDVFVYPCLPLAANMRITMIDVFVRSYLPLATLIFFIALFRYRKFSPAMQVLVLIIFYDVITEWLAEYAAVQFKNNHPIYSFNTFINFSLTALYFNFSIVLFRKYQIGILIGVIGTFLGMIDTYIIEPQNTLKLNFDMFSSLLIIIMSLYAIYDLTIRKQKDYWNNPEFWVAFVFMAYRLCDFLYWGFFNIIGTLADLPDIFYLIHISLSSFYYIAFGIIFLRFPRTPKR